MGSLFLQGLILVVWVALTASIILFKKCILRFRYQAIEVEAYGRFQQSKLFGRILRNSSSLLMALNFIFTVNLLPLGAYLYGLVRALHPNSFLSSGIIFLVLILVAVGLGFFLKGYVVSRWVVKHNQAVLEHVGLLLLAIHWLLFPIFFIVRKLSRRFGLKRPTDAPMQYLAYLSEQLKGGDSLFSSRAKRIALNALRLRELDVSDIVLPRSKMQCLDLEDSLENNIEIAKKAGHTRFPLFQGDLDHCVGIIHIKDLFHYSGDLEKLSLKKIVRKLLKVPELTTVEDALERMLRLNVHMAIVIDEFGGTLGLITLEKILEELVGPIQDEFDTEEESLIKPLPGNRYLVLGLTPIHDLEEQLGLSIENDVISTVGGLITSELGRIPQKGEQVSLEGLNITVEEVDAKKIISVILFAEE